MSVVGPKLRRVLAWKLLPGARSARRRKSSVHLRRGSTTVASASCPDTRCIGPHVRSHHRCNAAALILALESGRQNTIELVRDRSERIIDTIVERTQLHLDPARDQSEFLARLFRDGDIDTQNEATLLSQLRAALAGIPQIAALAVIRTDLKQLRVERHGDDVVMRKIDMRTVPGLDEAFEMARSAGRPVWGELLWSERLNQPLVNVRTPLWHEHSFLGILLTTVTVAELSRFLAESPAGSNVGAFILLGRNHVLAHAALAHNPQLFKRDKPLPEVSEIGDPVLASIWNPDAETGAAAFVGSSKSHIVTVDHIPYVFIYRDISGYSDQPWVVGRYLPLDELGSEVRRLEHAAWLGLAAVLAAVASAWLVGYSIGKPISAAGASDCSNSHSRSHRSSPARRQSSSRTGRGDQGLQLAHRDVALVRNLRTATPGQAVDGTRRTGDRTCRAGRHCAVYRHRRLHKPCRKAIGIRCGNVPQ